MTVRHDPDTRHLLDRLLHLGRVLSRHSSTEDLTPGQWSALRYLGRANRFSRTVSGLAEYQAITPASASRMVSELEDRGLARRREDPRDGRRRRIDLTAEGRQTLDADPLAEAAEAMEELPAALRGRLAEDLGDLALRVHGRCGGGVYGTCGRCRHLESGGSARPGACVCARFGSELRQEELGRICVDFEPVR